MTEAGAPVAARAPTSDDDAGRDERSLHKSASSEVDGADQSQTGGEAGAVASTENLPAADEERRAWWDGPAWGVRAGPRKWLTDVVPLAALQEFLSSEALAPGLEPKHVQGLLLLAPAAPAFLACRDPRDGRAVPSVHFLQLLESLGAVARGAPLPLPRALAPVKRALMELEAAIPDEAMPLWDSPLRDHWTALVKYAREARELVAAALILETCIEPAWMRPRWRPIARALVPGYTPRVRALQRPSGEARREEREGALEAGAGTGAGSPPGQGGGPQATAGACKDGDVSTAESTEPESMEWAGRLEPFSSVAPEGTAAERRSGRKPSVRNPPSPKREQAGAGASRASAAPEEEGDAQATDLRYDDAMRAIEAILAGGLTAGAVAATPAGVAALVYHLDRGYDFSLTAVGGPALRATQEADELDRPPEAFRALRTGNVVWVMQPGTRAWPAEVCTTSDLVALERNPGRRLVLFFSWEQAWVDAGDVLAPFDPHASDQHAHVSVLSKLAGGKWALDLARKRVAQLALISTMPGTRAAPPPLRPYSPWRCRRLPCAARLESSVRGAGVDKNTGMYALPRKQRRELEVGAIVEADFKDPKSEQTEWIPAKITKVCDSRQNHKGLRFCRTAPMGTATPACSQVQSRGA